MKGTLHKTEKGWQVFYHAKEDLYYGKTRLKVLPLHPDDTIGIGQEENEIEFEIVDNKMLCDCSCHTNPNMIHFTACCKDGYKIDSLQQYAKLVDYSWIKMKEDDLTVNFKPLPKFNESFVNQQQIAQECFKKYPNNKELYNTQELKDAYMAGVVDGFKEATKKQDND